MRKKIRRFNHLFFKYIHYIRDKDREFWEDYWENSKNDYQPKDNRYAEIVEFFRLKDELGISDDKFKELKDEKLKEVMETRGQYSKRPVRERKDNKRILNTSKSWGGSGSYPTYRYPKKNRSKTTWARFYALFPRLAVQDGWNGKTSKRMK